MKINLSYHMHNEEAEKHVIAEWRETPTGWVLKFPENGGINVYLTKQGEQLKMLRFAEWKTQAIFNEVGESQLTLESSEGRLDFELEMCNVVFYPMGVSLKYRLAGQDEVFHFEYRWEYINE